MIIKHRAMFLYFIFLFFLTILSSSFLQHYSQKKGIVQSLFKEEDKKYPNMINIIPIIRENSVWGVFNVLINNTKREDKEKPKIT